MSSAKYYQNHKEGLQKKLLKDIKVFLEKKKKKSDNMVVNDTKIYQKMKTESWLSIEKNIYHEKKHLIITIRNYFHLENLVYYLQVFFKECKYIL